MKIRKLTAALLALVMVMGSLVFAETRANAVPGTGSFESVSVYLAADLTLHVTATVSAGVTPKVSFNGAGKSDIADGTATATGFAFDFGGIYAQCMGDAIEMKLLDGETVLDTKTFSVKDYFNSLYGKTAQELKMTAQQNAALKRLMADTLEFGAAAQTYMSYNTSALVNDLEWVAAERTPAFTAPATDASVIKAGTSDAILSASLVITNYVQMRFRAKAATADRITVKAGDADAAVCMLDGTPDTDGCYNIRTSGLAAADFDEVWTVTLTDGEGNVYSQVQYSVNSYVAAMCNDTATENLAPLVRALYNYGVSADAYAEISADVPGLTAVEEGSGIEVSLDD